MMGNNIHILSTGLLSESILNKINKDYIQIEEVPFIKTQPILAESLLRTILKYSKQTITAIITSTNSISALETYLEQKPNWQIFCLGGVTKDKVKETFGEDAILGTARNASLLAEKIILSNPSPNTPLVFFCGEQRLDELPTLLNLKGIQLEEIVVYETSLTPAVIEKNYDGILFYSPSAVHSFFSINTTNTNTIFFAIGHTTAQTIRTYVSNEICVSDFPSKEHLIEQTIDYFQKLNPIPLN